VRSAPGARHADALLQEVIVLEKEVGCVLGELRENVEAGTPFDMADLTTLKDE
jgi:hypothetical protein